MSVLNKSIGCYPLGIWIAFVALVLILIAWIMQSYSLIDWEGAVELGLQNESFSGNETERAVADVERGIAIADILWVFPIWLIAFIGLLRKRFFGFLAAMMEFAICVYFPLFYIFRDSSGQDIVLGVLLLWLIPSLLGIMGLWANRDLFRES
ncbi:hypothetical protein HQ585_16940 [candidate division KSB1 bacterium]|nr:hypothetical protein [candidate division KSB1 bacterium]